MLLTVYVSRNYIKDRLTQRKAALFLVTSLTSVLLFFAGYELLKPTYTFKEAQQVVSQSTSLEILNDYQPTILNIDTDSESYLVTTSDGTEVYQFTVNPTTGAIEKLKK